MSIMETMVVGDPPGGGQWDGGGEERGRVGGVEGGEDEESCGGGKAVEVEVIARVMVVVVEWGDGVGVQRVGLLVARGLTSRLTRPDLMGAIYAWPELSFSCLTSTTRF
jgi:hypothetical protein